MLIKRFVKHSIFFLLILSCRAFSSSDLSGIYTNTDGDQFSIVQYGSTISSQYSLSVAIPSPPAGFTGPFTINIEFTATVAADGSYTGTSSAETRDANNLLLSRYSANVSGTFANETITETATGTTTLYNSDGSVLFTLGPTTVTNTYQRIALLSPTANASGTQVIGQTIIQTSVKQTTTMISRRIAAILKPISSQLKQSKNDSTSEFTTVNRDAMKNMFDDLTERSQFNFELRSGELGLSAGDMSKTKGFWANIASSDLEDSNTSTESDTDITTFITGFDQKLNEQILVGISLTYEDVAVKSYFNNGSLNSDGFTLAPYIAYSINDSLAVYAVLGYGLINYDQDKNNGSASSDLDADRSFAEINLMAFQSFDRVIFNERIGYLYTHESQDSYTEYNLSGSSVKIGSNSITFSQLKVNLEISYAGDELEPYFDLGYYYDTDYEKVSGVKNDRNGGDYTLGLRLNLSEQLSGDISATQNFNRHKLNETSFSATLRYNF
jgi:outer membrane autotransporter protein